MKSTVIPSRTQAADLQGSEGSSHNEPKPIAVQGARGTAGPSWLGRGEPTSLCHLRPLTWPQCCLSQLLMVVSVVLERNPELEFQDKVDLDKLVKEAFQEFQKDESQLKGVENQVSRENSFS